MTEEQLQATGLAEKVLATYRLVHSTDPPMSRVDASEALGVVPGTVKRHLSAVAKRTEDPDSMEHFKRGGPTLDQSDPEKYAAAVVGLSAPVRSVAAVARKTGVHPTVAAKIAKELDGELLPVKRAVRETRIEDLTKRFGTLSVDAIDAITEAKLEAATAQQLAVIAGIAADKWQLLRGMPTQRLEVSDRRKMDDIVLEIVKEAKRRHIEIDVTAEGEVTAKKSPFKNAGHRDEHKRLHSGDPDEILSVEA